MPISIDLVELAEIPLHPYMQKVMDSGVRKHFKSYDAQRVSYAFSKAQFGETFLEVGPGRCDLTIMVARSGLYSKRITRLTLCTAWRCSSTSTIRPSRAALQNSGVCVADSY